MFEAQSGGGSGANRGTGLRFLDELLQVIQASLPATYLEQCADHPPHLIAQETAADERDIEAISTGAESQFQAFQLTFFSKAKSKGTWSLIIRMLNPVAA